MIGFLSLSASIDVTYEVDELVLGGVTRPHAVTRVAGGKSLNAARAAHACGADVAVVVALGGHGGGWIADELAREGVRAVVIPVVGETRMCFAIADGASSSTDVYEPAPPMTPSEWGAFAAQASKLSSEWVAVSGSVPAGVPLHELAGMLERLRAGGRRIAVDASGAVLDALAPHADLLKVNLAEASDLLDVDVPDASAAATGLHARWGVTAIVTDGVHGGAAAGERTIDLPPPSRVGRFPAGSGDAFLGGLLAALDGGESLDAALTAAADAGMRNALVPGAGRLAAAAAG